MIAALVFIGVTAVLEGSGSLSWPIESCDGSSKGYFTGHADGEDWFSLKGRVVGSDGKPVCGAWVSAEYLSPIKTEYGELRGPVSPTGRNGEFFLDNLRKGAAFRLRVNPYKTLELRVRSDGLAALDSFTKTQDNVRAGGLSRYESEELQSTAPSGLMTLDIKLEEDPTATGIVVGTVGVEGPYDVEAPAVARVLVAGKAPIEAPVDRRTGEFVVFGVPAGQHRVDVEVSTKRQRHAMSTTVTVLAGKDSVARVELLSK